MDPATIALITAAISAAGSIGGGILGRDQGLNKMQKKQTGMLDMILDALKGEGPLAGMLQGDENAFNKSIVEPMMSTFQNQVAPNIQQGFISNRLQGGTGLNDALARAGVDLQSQINQQYLPFQQGASNRMMQMLQAGLGFNVPGGQSQSPMQAGLQGLAGWGSQQDPFAWADRFTPKKEEQRTGQANGQ